MNSWFCLNTFSDGIPKITIITGIGDKSDILTAIEIYEMSLKTSE
jgi:hypothetical protein